MRTLCALRADVTGHLKPGDHLDSESVLAKRFSANHQTIRRAMDLLVREGLIRRARGRGTVVVDRLMTGHVAIVLSPGSLGAEASPFYAKMISALTSQFHERNPRVSLRLHLGRDISDGFLYPQTLDLLEPDVRKDLRGVFTFHPLHEVGEELRQSNIPILNLGSALDSASKNPPFSVRFDHLSMVEMAVSRLKAASCKRIGMVWAHNRTDIAYENALLHQRAVGALTAGGLQVCESWLKPRGSEELEQTGYDAMMQLWALNKKIDGLIVPDDISCRGVLRAVSELGVHLPNDLKLVSFANRGVNFPYPKSVTRVEYDAMELAQHAVRKMIDLTSRHPENEQVSMMLKGKLVEGQTT